MTKKILRELLKKYKRGELTEDSLISRLSNPSAEVFDFATFDKNRELRRGFPEVIYCEYKSPEQVAGIAAAIVKNRQPLLATRATEEHFKFVKRKVKRAVYHRTARAITLDTFPRETKKGVVLVVTAGTSDLPVAEEAVITLRCMGSPVKKLNDVGVAGIHRLLHKSNELQSAAVIIVVAGMEGALPSVVGGLVEVPVIAVPTSVGYGVSLGGVTALLGMLSSCASGITVVNIDNGFGAGYAAHLMNR
jgi:pyridinium-3,5-biscarboxylic acid mononucleotide synthase